jgi:hypothetical protein
MIIPRSIRKQPSASSWVSLHGIFQPGGDHGGGDGDVQGVLVQVPVLGAHGGQVHHQRLLPQDGADDLIHDALELLRGHDVLEPARVRGELGEAVESEVLGLADLLEQIHVVLPGPLGLEGELIVHVAGGKHFIAFRVHPHGAQMLALAALDHRLVQHEAGGQQHAAAAVEHGAGDHHPRRDFIYGQLDHDRRQEPGPEGKKLRPGSLGDFRPRRAERSMGFWLRRAARLIR